MRKHGSLFFISAMAMRLWGASVQLDPLSGQVQGTPGSITGWGFTIINDSPVDWISFVVSFPVNETNPALGTYVDVLGPQGGPVNFTLGPNQTWSQTFSANDLTGAGLYIIDPGGLPGAVNSGQIEVLWESFSGDPSSCNCSPAQFSQDLDFQVTVVDAPEPAAGWLLVAGALVLGAMRLRRHVPGIRGILFASALAGAGAAQAQTFTDIVNNHSDPSGACGAPGLHPCANSYGCAPLTGNILRSDPYTALLLCDLPTSCSAFAAPVLPGPLDLTFLVATDLHFGRNDISSREHVLQVRAMNQVYKLGYRWSDAGGGMDSTLIRKPIGLVATGDLTHGGHGAELGQYRMLYEENRLGESIEYMVFPGAGNHDMDDDCAYHNCSHRMFDYMSNAVACVANVDSASHNYSWDWGPVHMIQLNKWAGDMSLGRDDHENQYYHLSGLPWLVNDLANHVGTSGRPVVIFQHFGWDHFSVDDRSNNWYPYSSTGGTNWWVDDQRRAFLAAIQNYNVVGIFNGHQHQPGMYATRTIDDIGKNFDNFTGGNGGIGGHGTFFAARVTDKFLDVVPFSWDEDVNQSNPVIASIKESTDANYPNFYNSSNSDGPKGCRKWIGEPLPAAPLTLAFDSSTPNGLMVRNDTGATLNGPFAIQFRLKTGHWLKSVSFVGSCSEGPVYQKMQVNSLLPGQSKIESLDLVNLAGNLSGSYALTDFSVVALGGDSMAVSPGVVALDSSATLPIDVSTVFGVNVPFTATADQAWVTVSSSDDHTPATLSARITPGATHFTHSAGITVHPLTAGYSDAHITVNLNTVGVTLQSGIGHLLVDGVDTAAPHTFSWYPGDSHTVMAQDSQGPASNRFHGWSDGIATALRTIVTPVSSATYTATYQLYYLVNGSTSPAEGGQLTLTPSSPDGFYLAGTPIQVQATAAANYTFTGFTGLGAIPPTSNSVQVPVTTPLTFSANFVPVGNYSVSTSLGASGLETVDGAKYTGPATVTWNVGTQHTFSVPAAIGGAPGVRDVFTTWSDGVATPSRTVTASLVNNYVAQYQRQYQVTTSVSPNGGGTLSGAGWYDAGTTAVLTAVPASGFKFGSFSGDAAGAANPASLAANGPRNVIANFTSGTPSLTAVPGPRDDTDPAMSVFTFVIRNSGAGAAADARIDSVATQTVAGSGAVTGITVPLVFGTILPGEALSQTIRFAWPQTATRVAFTVRFSANGGGYQGQTTFYVLR